MIKHLISKYDLLLACIIKMAIKTLEPINIILTNIYFIMLVQIAFNWKEADCSTNSNIFQIAFLFTLIFRILLISSGAFLTGLCVYQTYTLSQNWQEFNYDAKTTSGSLICYQNRIVFVTEIIIGFLSVAKDVALIILNNEKPT